jgi:hypothetical protein
MLADEVDYVIGIDRHRGQHTLAVVVASTGAVVAQSSFRANGRGYVAALALAGSTPGVLVSGRWKAQATTGPG